MKSLYYEKHYDQEQFQICIKNLPSDQRADSQVNLSKLLENIGTILLKLAQILPKTAPENFHRGCLSKIQREWKCDLRYVENHVKNLWRSFFIFVKIVNIFTEKLHHRCLTVSWIHLGLLCCPLFDLLNFINLAIYKKLHQVNS